MQIITNKRRRQLVGLQDLPAKVQLDFDYVREAQDCSYRFVKYSGRWYDTHDTMVVRTGRGGSPLPSPGWDSYESDSFFSGVLFRFVGDDEVIVGRYWV